MTGDGARGGSAAAAAAARGRTRPEKRRSELNDSRNREEDSGEELRIKSEETGGRLARSCEIF